MIWLGVKSVSRITVICQVPVANPQKRPVPMALSLVGDTVVAALARSVPDELPLAFLVWRDGKEHMLALRAFRGLRLRQDRVALRAEDDIVDRPPRRTLSGNGCLAIIQDVAVDVGHEAPRVAAVIEDDQVLFARRCPQSAPLALDVADDRPGRPGVASSIWAMP
jgi:hypothetical protein